MSGDQNQTGFFFFSRHYWLNATTLGIMHMQLSPFSAVLRSKTTIYMVGEEVLCVFGGGGGRIIVLVGEEGGLLLCLVVG